MEENKLRSMAKTMKYLPALIGALFIVVAAFSLFLKTEDPSLKLTVLLFVLMGAVGIMMALFGMALSALLEKAAKEKAPEEDSDADVLA